MSELALPKGWTQVSFDDVLENISNGVGGKQNQNGIGLPVSRIETIANESFDFNRIGFIEDPDKKDVSKYRLNVGDILFSHINSAKHLGKTAIFKNGELYHGINLLRLEVNKSITTPEFFNYFCNYLRANGYFSLNAKHAVNQASINQKALKTAPIVLPSLAEQNKISDLLGNYLTTVSQIKARLDAIPKLIEKFRQSVLNDAVSGKLTEDWREKRGLNISDWKPVVLSDVIEKTMYGTSKKSSKEGDVPVLRMGNLQSGEIDWNNLVYTSDSVEIDKFDLKSGDLLFNRTNSPELVGKTSIYRGNRKAIFAGYLIRLRPLETADSEFLNYHLNSAIAKDYCYKVKSDGVSQSNINAKKISAYPFELPSIDEQKEIVKQVKQLFAHADQIEKNVAIAKARVDNLTQSILHQAFTGQLTKEWREQNPALISGDNSAEALLAKIEAEKKASGKKGKAKK